MGRKKSDVQVKEQAPQVLHCGDCSKAYGYCVKGFDGLPVFCRCSKIKGRVLLLSNIACSAYSKRKESLPVDFPYGFSDEMN